MNDPWFDPMLWSWVPGTVLGVTSGILGAVGGMLAPQGKAKGLVLGTYGFVMVVCVLLLVLGIVALCSGQPYGVWYGLGLPGLVGTFVLGGLLPVIKLRYREAEERKMLAQDV